MMKKIIDFAITKTNLNNIVLIHTMVQIDSTETKTGNDVLQQQQQQQHSERRQKPGSKASESLLILLVCLFIVSWKR